MDRFPALTPAALGIAISGLAVCTWLGGEIASNIESTRQRQQLASDLSLRRELLRSEIERHRLLPKTLAGDTRLRYVIQSKPGQPERASASLNLSQRFEELARADGAATLYLMDAQGTTVSSSNFRSGDSFVGQNYAFRPYFRDAMRSGSGEFFARGTVSGVPGLYLAHRIDSNVGVVVVKVEFDEIESRWRETGDQTVAMDQAGVVLLTSDSAARFSPFTEPSRAETPWLIEAVAQLDTPSWRLAVRRDIRRSVFASRSVGWLTGGTLGGLVALIALVAVASRERREKSRLELERLVASRTIELRDANQRLQLEIDERARSDASVQKLRDDLAQANRLAILGQISAGVAHEINQPVAAIRANVDNARVLICRDRTQEAAINLERIADLTDRIGLITNELREFARRTPLERKPIRLASAIEGANLLLDSTIRTAHIDLQMRLSPADPQVLANRIKLEQVVVNLLQNAVEALSETQSPQILIETRVDDTAAYLIISDNGPGLTEEQLQHIFTPFSTTKAIGLGLGLVISRDIISELGGTLDYARAPAPGASFQAKFPLFRPA